MFAGIYSTEIHQDSTGFTLLEVMIAMAIMAIALVALYGSQSMGLSYATEARFNTIAASLAETKLAELQSGITGSAQESGDFGEQYPGYTWQVSIDEVSLSEIVVSAAPWKKLQKISLQVQRDGSPYSCTLRYYRAIGHE
ncbi:type IV pilus modification PilV family protein [Desulfomarina sp.]